MTKGQTPEKQEGQRSSKLKLSSGQGEKEVGKNRERTKKTE